MNFIEEYEAEIAAKFEDDLAFQKRVWDALGPEGQMREIERRQAAQDAEDRRQERIAMQFDEIYGPDGGGDE